MQFAISRNCTLSHHQDQIAVLIIHHHVRKRGVCLKKKVNCSHSIITLSNIPTIMAIASMSEKHHHHHGKRKINMLLNHRQYCCDNEDALRKILTTMTPTDPTTSSDSSCPVSDGEDYDKTENNKRRKRAPSEERSASSIDARTSTSTVIIGTNDSRVRSSATSNSWKNPHDHRSKSSSLPLLAIVSSSFQTLPDHDCDERPNMVVRTNTKSLEDGDGGGTIGDSCTSFSSSSSLWRRPYQSYDIMVNSTTYTAALQDQYNCDHTPLSPRPQLFRI